MQRSDSDREQCLRLLRRYRTEGDVDARRRVIEDHLPLARRLARRFRSSHASYEDLVQVASLALVKAVDRFDIERGAAFETYAIPTIVGELQRHLRDRTWAVRPPRGLQEQVAKVSRTADVLSQELGRSPAAREVAETIGEDRQFVVEAFAGLSARVAESLDAPAGADEHESWTLADTVGGVEDPYGIVEDRDLIERALKAIPKHDRALLRLRYEEDLTQGEIARLIGMSQMTVSRVIRRSLANLQALNAAST